MRIEVSTSGDFKKTIMSLNASLKYDPRSALDNIGNKATAALSSATPVNTGETARSWTHTVKKTSTGWDLIINNNGHPEVSVNVAKILQYGHGTGTGGYVPGRDYINPVLTPVFEYGANLLLKEMSK